MRKQTFFRNIFTSHCCHCTEEKKRFFVRICIRKKGKKTYGQKRPMQTSKTKNEVNISTCAFGMRTGTLKQAAEIATTYLNKF